MWESGYNRSSSHPLYLRIIKQGVISSRSARSAPPLQDNRCISAFVEMTTEIFFFFFISVLKKGTIVSCVSEVEAKEACDWLRAAGFPQYAQLFEGNKSVPADIHHKDEDRAKWRSTTVNRPNKENHYFYFRFKSIVKQNTVKAWMWYFRDDDCSSLHHDCPLAADVTVLFLQISLHLHVVIKCCFISIQSVFCKYLRDGKYWVPLTCTHTRPIKWLLIRNNGTLCHLVCQPCPQPCTQNHVFMGCIVSLIYQEASEPRLSVWLPDKTKHAEHQLLLMCNLFQAGLTT